MIEYPTRKVRLVRAKDRTRAVGAGTYLSPNTGNQMEPPGEAPERMNKATTEDLYAQPPSTAHCAFSSLQVLSGFSPLDSIMESPTTCFLLATSEKQTRCRAVLLHILTMDPCMNHRGLHQRSCQRLRPKTPYRNESDIESLRYLRTNPKHDWRTLTKSTVTNLMSILLFWILDRQCR